MIFGIAIADIVVGVIAAFLVGLCVYSVVKKKKGCSGCGTCPYSDKCKKVKKK